MTDGTDRRKVKRDEKVVCEECSEFEMSKGFKGASATNGEREYVDMELPDECPVCGAETARKRGGRRAL